MKDRLKPTNKLRAYWSKRENDIMFWYPKWKADGGMLKHFLCDATHSWRDGTETTLIEELERRGFDITTIKFSVAYKESEDDTE